MIYILIMNVIGFCLMGLDKHRARTRQWRVPEKILFGAALLGGSAGAWAGMYVFHHKTRHWYFVVGIPLILRPSWRWLFILRAEPGRGGVPPCHFLPRCSPGTKSLPLC